MEDWNLQKCYFLCFPTTTVTLVVGIQTPISPLANQCSKGWAILSAQDAALASTHHQPATCLMLLDSSLSVASCNESLFIYFFNLTKHNQ